MRYGWRRRRITEHASSKEERGAGAAPCGLCSPAASVRLIESQESARVSIAPARAHIGRRHRQLALLPLL